MNNSASSPAAVYRRGETIDVIWVRNSHHGGIVRLGFVPVSAMWNRAAHSKLAIFYGCWDDHKMPCKVRNFRWCGTDNKGFSLTARLTVPTCLPDGDYVFSYSWFGGLHFKRKRGGFPDFNHCSHVSIRGGVSPSGKCTPVFRTPSGPSASSDRTKCLTSATQPGTCVKKECDTPAFYAKPRAFTPNAPPSFTASDVAYVADNPASTLPEWPVGGGADAPRTSRPPSRSTHAAATPSRSRAPAVAARCAAGVCCSAGCARCAGHGCHKHGTRAGDLCCTGAIIDTGRSCDRVGPPCVCRGRVPKNCPKGFTPPKASPSRTPRPAGSRDVHCSSGVCCSPGCKGCGGADCHLLKTGPSQQCCTKPIRLKRRSCEMHSPPCVCKLGRTKNCPS